MTDSRPIYDSAVDENAALAGKGYVRLHSIEAENPNTVKCYLQLFDAAAVADVTVGTTTPTVTLYIPPGDGTENGVRTKEFDGACRFEKGLVYACTTGREDNGAPTTDLPINLTIS